MPRNTLALLAAFAIPAAAPAMAQDGDRPVRIVEDVPKLSIPKTVSASATPSGLPVPRYVSLKVGKANCRIGPTRSHAVAYQYQRRGLPLVVIAETELWRRVRDVNGDQCWIKATGLSGARHALTLDRVELHAKPKADSKTRAVAERGTVVSLGECSGGWCEVRAGGFKGWARERALWGAGRLP